MNPKEKDLETQTPLRRSSRLDHAPDRLNLIVLDDIANEDNYVDDDPKTYVEAMKSLDRETGKKP